MSVVTSITSKPIPSRRKRADCFEWSRAGGAAARCNASINFTLGGGRGRRRIERLEAVHHPTDLNSIRVSISIRTRDAITFLFARRTGRRWLNLMEYERIFEMERGGFGFSTWHEANFFNSENYIIGQLRVRRVRRKRSRWRMIESCARVGNFIVLLERLRGIYLTS